MGKLINIDNGGTLTDICVIDGAVVTHTKTITTPYDLSKCFFEGLKKASKLIYGEERVIDLLLSTDHIRYSTTQGTNALVERKGPRVGLLIGKNDNPDDLVSNDAAAALLQALVGDRIAKLDAALTGEEFEQEVVKSINRLTNAGVNRIVASLSGVNYSQDERRFRDAVLTKFPRHLLGVVPVVCASHVFDDVDRVRRTWTALIDAFLNPTMETFLYNAEGILREYYHQNPLLIFRNDGDSSRVSRSVAIKTLSSGPRGGMEGARALANHHKFKRLLSMDIGGTTTDIGLVEDGKVQLHAHGNVEGVTVSLSLSEILSVGVGGSSIISWDKEAIKVGPESVGGAPGPACFGLGGQNATITDVVLLTGLIDPATYFGGAMKLDSERAATAIRVGIANHNGQSLEKALELCEEAWVRKVADSLTRFTTIDADTVLAAFGGAGPLLVTDVAEAAGIDSVIIPSLAAVFSAFGIGFSDIAQSYRVNIPSFSDSAVSDLVAVLTLRARRDMFAEGFDLDECVQEWVLFRSAGDEESEIRWAPGQALPKVAAGNQLALGLRVVRPINRARFATETTALMRPAIAVGTRKVRVPKLGAVELPVYRIPDQAAGASGEGPCILEEDFFTARVSSGWRFEINANRDAVLTRVE